MAGSDFRELGSPACCSVEPREVSSLWTAENPASGQCNPTALVVQDLLRRDLLKTMLPEGWHIYNRVGGRRLDFNRFAVHEPASLRTLPPAGGDHGGTSDAQCEALRPGSAGPCRALQIVRQPDLKIVCRPRQLA